MEGPARALPTRHGSACNRTACFTPAHLIFKFFVLTGNFCGWGRGGGRLGRSGQMQEPEGGQGWGRLSRGKYQGRRMGDKQQDGGGEEEYGGNETMAAQASGRRHEPKSHVISNGAGGGEERTYP